jgi:hypothetical protein
MGEGHSSNLRTDNLQECPSKAPALYSDSRLPYLPLIKNLFVACIGDIG